MCIYDEDKTLVCEKFNSCGHLDRGGYNGQNVERDVEQCDYIATNSPLTN